MISSEAGNCSAFMLGHTAIEIVGMTGVKGPTSTMQHIGPKTHYPKMKKEQGFDKLSPSGLVFYFNFFRRFLR